MKKKDPEFVSQLRCKHRRFKTMEKVNGVRIKVRCRRCGLVREGDAMKRGANR